MGRGVQEVWGSVVSRAPVDNVIAHYTKAGSFGPNPVAQFGVRSIDQMIFLQEQTVVSVRNIHNLIYKARCTIRH